MESTSGFSSSGYSFQSVIGGEHEVNSLRGNTSLENPCPDKIEAFQQHKNKSSKPQNQKRDQPLKVKYTASILYMDFIYLFIKTISHVFFSLQIQENNHMAKSTEV